MDIRLNCIMLVDDDKLTNALNKALLDNEKCCHYVIKRKSAISGLYYLTRSAQVKSQLPFPELIFLDIAMPVISGWDFMKYFQGITDSLPTKPIIYMLSSYALEQDSLKVSEVKDLHGVFQKPLTLDTMQTIIEKHFVCV